MHEVDTDQWLVRKQTLCGTKNSPVFNMARLLSLLLLNVAVNAASPASQPRLPFFVGVRGGGDAPSIGGVAVVANSASSIPAGGSSYSSELESVKATVLKAASESVRVFDLWRCLFGGNDGLVLALGCSQIAN
jgi:hypothetical protein